MNEERQRSRMQIISDEFLSQDNLNVRIKNEVFDELGYIRANALIHHIMQSKKAKSIKEF